jgi:hypothetical protein
LRYRVFAAQEDAFGVDGESFVPVFFACFVDAQRSGVGGFDADACVGAEDV